MAFGDQRVVERDVPPGGWFGAGAEPGAWMFTACPVGYAPSVRFAAENRTAISREPLQLPSRAARCLKPNTLPL